MRKKIVSIIILILGLSGCVWNKEFNQTNNSELSYQEFKLKKELEFGVDEEIKSLYKEKSLLSEKSEELKFPNYNFEQTNPSLIEGKYTYENKIYTIKKAPKDPTDFIVSDAQNNELLKTDICSFGANEPISQVREINNSVAIDFIHECEQKNNRSTGIRNIFYEEKTINEEYNVTQSKQLFVYKNKVGFIKRHENKEYIYFNGKIISPGFDSIHNQSCCSLPSHFKIYENGALVFLATKNGDYYIIEIDLDKYL